MSEIWKNVIGYEGIYEVSNTGKVRTHKDKTSYTERHGTRKWSQRILKQKISKDHCCRVDLWKDNEGQTWLVHRLVALAFIPLIEGKEYVNHDDGDRLNNSVNNLEWSTHTENNNHAFDNRLIKTGREITLVNKTTKEEFDFRSMTKASEFLNKNHGFISRCVEQNKMETDEYEITIK